MSDQTVRKHFGHHDKFLEPHPGRSWSFRLVAVPVAELLCLYTDPGVQDDNPAGLMGSVGAPATGYVEKRIEDMAAAVARGLSAGTADRANPALRKLLAFCDGGVEFIKSVAEPSAISIEADGRCFVREGTHRAIALVLLNQRTVQAIDFESAALV